MSYAPRFSKGFRKVGDAYGRAKTPFKSHFKDAAKPFTAKTPPRDSERIYGVQSVIGALTSKKRQVYNMWMKTELSKKVDRYVAGHVLHSQFLPRLALAICL